MKRILLITNYTSGNSGITVQVKLLQEKLREEQYIADLFTTKGSFIYRLFVLFKLISQGKRYDAFHIHACSDFGFFPAVTGVLAGRFLKKRIVLTYHGGGADVFFKKRTKFVRHFLLRTDYNIVLSGFLESVFKKYNIPCVVIPNILDIKDKFKIRNHIHPNFISIRALQKEYNIACIIKAFHLFVTQFPEATLTILGDGNCRNDLENLVKTENVPNISFLGKVDNKYIYDYLDKADIFLSSPLVDNQPVSILEAFNAGLLVISSNVGGVPYIVKDKKNGLIFQSNNEEELFEKMMYAIRNQNHAKEMIQNANIELKNYSWDIVKERLLPLYH